MPQLSLTHSLSVGGSKVHRGDERRGEEAKSPDLEQRNACRIECAFNVHTLRSLATIYWGSG